jgi:N-methylhydantoinase B
MALDPVDYAVVSQALAAAAREMGIKLVRSAYSTIVREARDASAAILDRAGNVIAQAEMIPMQLGSMGVTLRACLDAFPADTLRESDFLVNNHPYFGGQHLQDVFIFLPVFVDGELVAFSGTVAHHLDLGGGGAGLNNSATDVYQEGLLLPPMRFDYERDWQGGNFERLLRANVRVPEQTLGDFNAQFSANRIGIERVRQLCRRYGVATVRQVMVALTDHAESQLRAAIREIPDGTYCGEDAMDDDGVHDQPVWIRAQVTVAGDSLRIGFEGTDAQVTRNINAPWASTFSAVMSCLKGVLVGSDVPFNEGSFRPVSVDVPLGSILNPRPPAPVRARMEPCYRAYCAVMKALAQVVPDKVISSGFDAALITCLARLADGRYRVCLETYGGGFGASAASDGADGIAASLSNTTNSPVEALDMEFEHFRIVSYGLARDSFGHGRHRGGAGLFRQYEVLQDGVDFSLYGDRFRIAPDGLFGGRSGSRASATLVRAGRELPLDLRHTVRLQRGDLVTITTSGGAGYGDPHERARAAVSADVEQGFLGAEQARAVYGEGC